MLILGIDPDVNKNGVALWNTITEKFELLKALDGTKFEKGAGNE